MGSYGLWPFRHAQVVSVCVLVWFALGFCNAIPRSVQVNATRTQKPVTTATASSDPSTKSFLNCTRYGSSCKSCSQNTKCAWCFSEKSCLLKELRNERNACDEDDWYYGDCDKPAKETVLVYVLLACALFLLMIVILLVLYIFFCKMPKNKDYEPVSTKEKKKKRKRTPLMSKKVKPTGSRTDELKKKYQLDG